MHIRLKLTLVLVSCLFSRFIITMQQQAQRQVQVYDQQKKLIKNKTDQKQKFSNDHAGVNATALPSNIHQAEKIDLIEQLDKQITTTKQPASSAKIEEDPKNDSLRNREHTDEIKTTVSSENKTSQAIELNDIPKTNTLLRTEPILKLKKHQRICPVCFDLSINCLHDQERLSEGEILPCACRQCWYKNHANL